MAKPNKFEQQFVTLINESVACANNGDFLLSFQKMRAADEFAATHSLEYLWKDDTLQKFVCNHCDRLITTLTDEGSDDIAMELLTWQQGVYPDELHVQYNFGRLAARRGDLAGTILHYEMAMHMVDRTELPLKDLTILITSLAVAYQRANETDQAVALMETEIRKRTWPATEKQQLEGILAYLKGEQTDVQIVSGQEHALNTASQLLDRANELDEAGKFHEAQPLYERAIRLAPEEPNIFYNYGVACAQQEDDALQEKAVQLYLEALRIDPQFRNAHANLAPLLLSREDFAGAAQHARKAIELGLDVYVLNAVLGISCASLGEYGEARTAFTRALALAEPAYRAAIQEYLAGLPAEDSLQEFSTSSRTRISKGGMTPTAEEKPLRIINADTFPRLGQQFARAMGKKFVEFRYSVMKGPITEIFFNCHDGEYKAVLPEDAGQEVKIYLVSQGREKEVFTIRRE